MVAARIGQNGRFAEVDGAVASGALLPFLRHISIPDLATDLTRNFRFYPEGAGTINEINIYSTITGTVTVDLLKNGVRITAAIMTLANNTRTQLKGFGTSSTANLNTDTDASKAKFRYEVGDYIDLTVITGAVSSITGFALEMACDEQQPV